MENDTQGILASWKDQNAGGSGAREEILTFVAAVTTAGADFVPPEERIAVFDNDGTLWGEQPDYVQVVFMESRAAAGSPDHDETIEEYQAAVMDWLATETHPGGMSYRDMVYQPMLELLDYLRANEFKVFIVSGGGREFVRPWSEESYGIPPEQVIGSNARTAYREDPPAVIRMPTSAVPGSERKYEETFFVDDKGGKVVGINNHIGRRPIAAFGNSDGDKQMLEWTTSGDGLRFGLLLDHTDGVREYDYSNGDVNPNVGHLGEETRQAAADNNWTVVDMATDWATVYPS